MRETADAGAMGSGPIETSSVVAVEGILSCGLADGAALLDVKTGTYYGLNEVGSAVWRHIEEPRHFTDIRDHLLARYDADPARCEEDLVKLLTELRRAGLVEVVDSESKQVL